MLNISKKIEARMNTEELKSLLRDYDYVSLEEEEHRLYSLNREDWEKEDWDALMEGTHNVLSKIWDFTKKVAVRSYQIGRTLIKTRRTTLLDLKYKLERLENPNVNKYLLNEYNTAINEKFAGLLTLVDGKISEVYRIVDAANNMCKGLSDPKKYRDIYFKYKFPKEHIEIIENYLSEKLGMEDFKNGENYYHILGFMCGKKIITYHVFTQRLLQDGNYKTEVRRVDVDLDVYEDIDINIKDTIEALDRHQDVLDDIEKTLKKYGDISKNAMKASEGIEGTLEPSDTKNELLAKRSQAEAVVEVASKAMLCYNSITTTCYDFIQLTAAYAAKADEQENESEED